MKKRLWIWILALLAAICLCGWIAWANTALMVTRLTVQSDALPELFDGFRIAHVSDLHNAEFGEGNIELLDLLRQAQPDVIAITGDLIDSRRTDVDVALEFIREAVKIAPCYFATGNHEARVTEYPALEQAMAEAGCTVLRGEEAVLSCQGQTIQILGVDDYTFLPGSNGNDNVEILLAETATQCREGFNILLLHRPELAERFADLGIELVLSGHAHGGQVRIPWIGGLIAPDQGFFPAYTEGLHTFGNMQLVISRGLGNSIIPVRVNNRPEIILITLEGEK